MLTTDVHDLFTQQNKNHQHSVAVAESYSWEMLSKVVEMLIFTSIAWAFQVH